MSRHDSGTIENRGASMRKRGAGAALTGWLARHRLAFGETFRQLVRNPVSTLMTVAVIGIALALPAGLHTLLTNARAVTSGWDGATQFSLFLKTGLAEGRVNALAEELRARRDIASVRLVSPDEALAEFRRLSGFGQALDALDGNPLPAVLVVRPSLKQGTAASVSALADQLSRRPEVDFAQADVAWVQRLYAIMSIANRGVWLLAAMLGLAVLLVVGNTIRLAVQNRRDEIVIAKLIGATDAFIRRPFLYTGLWYGLAGGLLAVALVTGSLWAVRGPAEQLALLYHSDHALQGLGLISGAGVIAGGGFLGLLGAWIAVGRHLREIEPT